MFVPLLLLPVAAKLTYDGSARGRDRSNGKMLAFIPHKSPIPLA